ncbi:MAG: DoxX family membrane protein [Acidocella sp.]|nr:DoxX family membrane protein [Acidocella sp.]
MLTWIYLVLLPLAARTGLVAMFPFSGLDKILHWKSAYKQASSSVLPAPALLLVLGMAVEFITPVCIIALWHARIAAFILAGFCAVTAVLYHQFWAFPDFWAPDDSVARSHFWDFLKNFGLAGGLLFVVLGASPPAITAMPAPAATISHP